MDEVLNRCVLIDDRRIEHLVQCAGGGHQRRLGWHQGPVNTRDELRGYDPEGYAFMADIYPEKTLPFPWDTNRDAYHLGETCEPLDLDPRFSYGGVRER